jgi:RimJ/RimL family protein N-acetyltransferase
MEKIRLRALTAEDAKITWKWQNSPEIKEFYSDHPYPVNYELEKLWYDKITYTNIPVTVFGIEVLENQKLIGMSILKNINLIHRSAELGIFIGDTSEKHKGYSSEATLFTLKFGFMDLGLNRIYLKVHEDNAPAIRLYEKTGFKKEGVMRKSVFKNDRFKNEIIMSLLNEEFRLV